SFEVAQPAGSYEATAAFLEEADFLGSSAAANVTVTAATVQITPGTSAATCPTGAPAGALCVQYSDQVALGTLRANGQILGLFSAVVDLGAAGTVVTFTDGSGRVVLSTPSLPSLQANGTYSGFVRVCPRS